MRKLCFLLLNVSGILISCQYSENIYINDDGTGNMSFVLDGSELMKMGEEEISGDAFGSDGKKKIDSTLVFKKFLEEKKDSISQLPLEEQEELKSLESFTVNLKMNTEKQEMKFNIFTNFEKVEELQDMMAAMIKVNSLDVEEQDKFNPMYSYGNSGAIETKYYFKKGVFKRKSTIADKELHQQALDSIGESEMLFASSSYVLNYHFPKPIKSVSNESVMFSADKKSLKLEVSYLEYLTNPEDLNLKVVLEK